MTGKRIPTKLDTRTVIQVLVGLLLVLCLVDDSFARVKCKKGSRFIEGANKSAICEKCECRAGYERDKTVKLKRVKGIGFTECPPCVPCPEGKYRTGSSLTTRCSKCVRNCTEENKYVAEPCGGTTAGFCGNCFHGFKMDSIDHNARCVPDTSVKPGCPAGYYSNGESCVVCSLNCSALHRIVAEKCGGTSRGTCGACQSGFSLTTADTCASESPDTNLQELDSGNQSPMHQTDNTKVVLIVVCIALVVSGSLGLTVYCIRKRRNNRSTTSSRKSVVDVQDCGQSSSKLINSGTTIGGDYNDLETDGPKKMVRGELPQCIIIETDIQDIIDQYSSTRVTLDMIKIVAENISDDNQVLRFFDAFPIRKTYIDPEHDLWLYGKHAFADYVFYVLKRWMGELGKNATLGKVCFALNDADFGHVVPLLINHVTGVRPELTEEECLSTAEHYQELHSAGPLTYNYKDANKTDEDQSVDAAMLAETKNDTVTEDRAIHTMKQGCVVDDSGGDKLPSEFVVNECVEQDERTKGTAIKEQEEPKECVEAMQIPTKKEQSEPSECAILMDKINEEKEDTVPSECVILIGQGPDEKENDEPSECALLMRDQQKRQEEPFE